MQGAAVAGGENILGEQDVAAAGGESIVGMQVPAAADAVDDGATAADVGKPDAAEGFAGIMQDPAAAGGKNILGEQDAAAAGGSGHS